MQLTLAFLTSILALAAATPFDNPSVKSSNGNGLSRLSRRQAGTAGLGGAAGVIGPPLGGPCRGDAVRSHLLSPARASPVVGIADFIQSCCFAIEWVDGDVDCSGCDKGQKCCNTDRGDVSPPLQP